MPSPILCAVVLIVYVLAGLFGFTLCVAAVRGDRNKRSAWERRR